MFEDSFEIAMFHNPQARVRFFARAILGM